MINPKELYKEIEEKRVEIKYMENQVDKDILQYRIKSVYRVLEYINDICWRNKDENLKNIHSKIVHCLNKLNGNIDGTELNLD